MQTTIDRITFWRQVWARLIEREDYMDMVLAENFYKTDLKEHREEIIEQLWFDFYTGAVNMES